MRELTMEERWMTLPEVAEYLQVSRDLIYRLAQKGKIPASKVGNQWRFKKEKIDQWMETQEAGRPRDVANQGTAGLKHSSRGA